MARLIDADALLQDGWRLVKTGKSNLAFKVMALDEVPTVDAVPVVHGRWELGKDKKPYCTACGKRALMDCTHEPEVGYGLYYYKKSEICPNCGAKMDGGAEDGSD